MILDGGMRMETEIRDSVYGVVHVVAGVPPWRQAGARASGDWIGCADVVPGGQCLQDWLEPRSYGRAREALSSVYDRAIEAWTDSL